MRYAIDLLSLAARSEPAARPAATLAVRYRGALVVAVLLSAALAYLATPAADAAHAVAAAGPELTRLLRLMALVKLAMAAAALGLVGWRLGHPARPALAWAYVAGCTLMAAGPGLIWTMAHVALGAALLHGGLLLLILLGWADGGLPLRRRADLTQPGAP